jgi:hypothetical protein
MDADVVRISGSENADEQSAFATKQRPFIAEETLLVVDYALVFPPGLLRRPRSWRSSLVFEMLS